MAVKAKGIITLARVDDGPAGEDGQMLYATCATAAATASKAATLKAGTLALKAGVTVAVMFTHANTAANPTLNIAGTGAKAVYMQGIRDVYWAAGATVSFTYDSAGWRVASEPVYATTATIGNAAGFNVYIDGDSVGIRYGSKVITRFASGYTAFDEEEKTWVSGNGFKVATKIGGTTSIEQVVHYSGTEIKIQRGYDGEFYPAIQFGDKGNVSIDNLYSGGVKFSDKATNGQRELLFSGSLAKGQSKVLGNANWKKYNLFQARTSDGITIMTGGRYDSGSNAAIRFAGGYDDGTKSYMFKASTTIGLSDNKLTVVGCSMHKYLTSSSGSGEAKALNIVELWGII